jgi:hypothetical protein
MTVSRLEKLGLVVPKILIKCRSIQKVIINGCFVEEFRHLSNCVVIVAVFESLRSGTFPKIVVAKETCLKILGWI